MATIEWVKRWGYWIAPKATRPGIWRLRDGGFLVRGRVTLPGTKGRKSVTRALRDATVAEAQRELDLLLETKRAIESEKKSKTPLFSDYAVSLLERKVGRSKIKSASGETKFGGVLKNHLIKPFGKKYLDEITRADVEAWVQSHAGKVELYQKLPKDEHRAVGALSPRTVNTRLSILKTILNAASEEYDLPKNPVAGVEGFDEGVAPTYTEEEPNSLTVRETGRFLEKMLELYPQHYAMTLFGFLTGQRPSHMQPIRYRGPTPDVLWSEKVVLIRRSHTEGQEVMETTKTGKHQRIGVPDSLLNVLRWHIATHHKTEAQKESDLLFPSRRGGYRFKSVLDKPFLDVAKEIGLRKHITPRVMRRTYQDIARAAGVADVITRSISGHQTEEMQHHYSTVAADEQRKSLERVASMVATPKPFEDSDSTELRGEKQGERDDDEE